MPAPHRSTADEMIARRHAEEAARDHAVRQRALRITGVLCLALGAYLLIDPGVSVESYSAYGVRSTADVVNLHTLVVGQTLAIVGTIILMVGVRQR